MTREELISAIRAAALFAEEHTSVEHFADRLVAELENPHDCAADYSRTWCVTCGRRMGP